MHVGDRVWGDALVGKVVGLRGASGRVRRAGGQRPRRKGAAGASGVAGVVGLPGRRRRETRSLYHRSCWRWRGTTDPRLLPSSVSPGHGAGRGGGRDVGFGGLVGGLVALLERQAGRAAHLFKEGHGWWSLAQRPRVSTVVCATRECERVAAARRRRRDMIPPRAPWWQTNSHTHRQQQSHSTAKKRAARPRGNKIK